MNSNPKSVGPYTTITVRDYRYLREVIECANDLARAVEHAPHPWPVVLVDALAKFSAARDRL